MADHDRSTASVVKEALLGAGYRVTVTTQGTHALSLTRRSEFDAMLIARNLPNLSAADVTRVVRQREESSSKMKFVDASGGDGGGARGKHLPIIIMSSVTSADDLREFMNVSVRSRG